MADEQPVDFFADPPQDAAPPDPAAGDDPEGAPVPEVSDAPPDADAPAEDGEAPAAGDEPPDQSEDIDTLRARLADIQRERDDAKRVADEARSTQERAIFEAAQIAWEREERDMLARTEEMNYGDALAERTRFYQGRVEQTMAWAQNAIQQANVEPFAANVIAHYGLRPADRARLGNNPQQFTGIAEAIKAERDANASEFSELKKRLQQLERGQQAGRVVGSGANRIGGTRASPSAAPLPDGEVEGLAYLLRQAGQYPRG